MWPPGPELGSFYEITIADFSLIRDARENPPMWLRQSSPIGPTSRNRHPYKPRRQRRNTRRSRTVGSDVRALGRCLPPHQDEERHPDAGEENGGEECEAAAVGMSGLYERDGGPRSPADDHGKSGSRMRCWGRIARNSRKPSRVPPTTNTAHAAHGPALG